MDETEISTAETRVFKSSIVWELKNYSFFAGEDEIDSPEFKIGPSGYETTWVLTFSPKGTSDAPHCFHTLKLVSCSFPEQTFYAKCQLSCQDVTGDEVAYSFEKPPKLKSFTPLSKKVTLHWYDFPTFDEVVRKAKGQLKDDQLNIIWYISIVVNYTMTPVMKLIHEEENMILDNFEELFNSEKFSDVVFSVGDREIRAHRAILCARSPVFDAMFTNDVKEKYDGRVEIKDIEFEVMKEVLRFVYTGKVPKLEEMAKEMFVAADKYDLKGLKSLCEEYMISHLSPDTVADYLCIAFIHNAGEPLKSRIIHFIKQNLKEVEGTDGWRNLKESCHHGQDHLFEMFMYSLSIQ